MLYLLEFCAGLTALLFAAWGVYLAAIALPEGRARSTSLWGIWVAVLVSAAVSGGAIWFNFVSDRERDTKQDLFQATVLAGIRNIVDAPDEVKRAKALETLQSQIQTFSQVLSKEPPNLEQKIVHTAPGRAEPKTDLRSPGDPTIKEADALVSRCTADYLPRYQARWNAESAPGNWISHQKAEVEMFKALNPERPPIEAKPVPPEMQKAFEDKELETFKSLYMDEFKKVDGDLFRGISNAPMADFPKSGTTVKVQCDMLPYFEQQYIKEHRGTP